MFSAVLFKSGNRWKLVSVVSRLELTVRRRCVSCVCWGLSAHTGSPRIHYTEHRSYSSVHKEKILTRCVLSFTDFFIFFIFLCWIQTMDLKCSSCCITLQEFGTKCTVWLDNWGRKLDRWVLVEINNSWRFISATIHSQNTLSLCSFRCRAVWSSEQNLCSLIHSPKYCSRPGFR